MKFLLNFLLHKYNYTLTKKTSSLEKKESFITSCCMLSDKEVDNFMKGDTI